MFKKLLFALLLLATPAFATSYGQRLGTAELDVNGFKKTLPGALINVCSDWTGGGPNYVCTQSAAIFQDCAGVIPIVQPLTSDSHGNYSWCAAAPGTYLEQVTAPGRGNVLTEVIYLSSGGGSTVVSCGVTNDVQINSNPPGGFSCDSTIFTEDPATHTLLMGGTTPGGVSTNEIDLIGGVGRTFPGNGYSGIAAPTGANARFILPAGVGTDGQFLTQTSHSGTDIHLGYASASGNCLGLAGQNTYCAGLVNSLDPRSAVVQDKMCTIGDTPTCTGGGLTVVCSVSSSPTSFAHCQFSVDQSITAGDVGYVVFMAVPGLGGSGINNSMSDTQGNTWTRMVNDDGSGSTVPTASYRTVLGAGTDTISVNFDTSAGFQFRGTFHFYEMRGTVTSDGFAVNAGSGFPFQPVTTTNATDTILGDQFIYLATCSYTPGSLFGLIDVFNGTVFSSDNLSMGSEATNVSSTGTYTPSITATGSGCGGGTGSSVTQAWTQNVYGGPGIPSFRWPRYVDLVAGLDFPSQAGHVGQALVSSGFDYQPLQWATTGGLTSIQFKNAGTNFGSPMTGTGSMNFVNATVSGTAPDFTVTVAGAGDTITSPNSTLAVGGTSSNTTLDVVGAAGKILAGSTPALTYTPVLGVDGTSAGTLQLANGTAAFHTILGTQATANWTFKFPVTAGTSGYVLQTDGSGNTSWAAAGVGGANTALSNLASVAINTTLLPASSGSADIGSTSKPFGTGYFLNALGIGSTPPSACSPATGCVGFNEAATAGTPTAGVDYMRADSGTHSLLCSFNGGAEAACNSGGGGGAPTFPVNTQTATYTATTADFAACKVIGVSANTFTVTLVATGSQPTNGQCIWITNFGSGKIGVAPNGQNLNGSGSTMGLNSGHSAFVVSNGTDYDAVEIAGIVTGSSNTYFGAQIFPNPSSTGNTLIGGSAGGAGANIGNNNTMVGNGAGSNGGSSLANNTLIGSNAGSSSGVIANSVAVGDNACALGASGDVCIGHNVGSSGGSSGGQILLGNSSGVEGASSVANYLNIANFIAGSWSKGILILVGPTTTIASNACGSTTQGTLTTGSNDMVGEVTVGTTAVTTCAVTFANTHNKAPFCMVTPHSSSTVGIYVSTQATTGFTVTGTALDSGVFDYHCFAGSTSTNPTP